jgi:hypothetical protein
MAHIQAHEVVVQRGGQLAHGHAQVRGEQPAHPCCVIDLGRQTVHGLVVQSSQQSLFVSQDHPKAFAASAVPAPKHIDPNRSGAFKRCILGPKPRHPDFV